MGYYTGSMILGGLVGRLGVALLTAVAGWRIAMGALALLPLSATLVMLRSLPEAAEDDEGRAEEGQRRRWELLRNRSLIAATVGDSSNVAEVLTSAQARLAFSRARLQSMKPALVFSRSCLTN